jgi:hypothetical protein
VAGWVPNPNYQECDEYVTDDGRHIARIEDFGYAAYPSALNAATGNWERYGACLDRVEGMLWAERVAGIHPLKPGDEMPPFYYMPREKPE